MLLLILGRTLGNLGQALLIEDGIVLLQLDHGLLSKSIDLVLILLVQNRHGVKHHEDCKQEGMISETMLGKLIAHM